MKKNFTLLLLTLSFFLPSLAQSPNLQMRTLSKMAQSAHKHFKALMLEGNEADTVYKTPEGTQMSYYYNDYIFDDYLQMLIGNDYAFQERSLLSTNIIWGDNNEVYLKIPVVVKNDYKGYIKGSYDETAKTVTFHLPQQIDNQGAELSYRHYIAVCDTAGLAGDSTTDTFAQRDLVFNVDDNGILSTEQPVLVGMFAGDDVVSSYGYWAYQTYIPADYVNSRMQKYNYNCYDLKHKEQLSNIVNVFKDDDKLYIKGFLPDDDYRNAWVKFYKSNSTNSYITLSGQVLGPSLWVGNDWFFAANLQADTLSDYVMGMQLLYDAEKDSLWSDDNTAYLQLGIDYTEMVRPGCEYTKAVLTPFNYQLLKPSAPISIEYSNNYNTSIKICLADTAETGEKLDTDSLFYIIYLNGEPYTFTTENYDRLSEDMTEIPFAFDDYYTVSASSDKRYISFENAPSDIKTIGVEMVYYAGGKSKISNRLVYNVADRTSEVVDEIKALRSTTVPVVVARYNLAGQRLNGPARGTVIEKYSDGSVKKVFRTK